MGISKLRALPYMGGKARPELSKWIRDHLLDWPMGYCEPFAGMLGVLLNRPPVRFEMVNDANKTVVNWWLVVALQPEAFADRLGLHPSSRYLHAVNFNTCEDKKDEYREQDLPPQGDLEWAVAWSEVVAGSFGGKVGSGWTKRLDAVRNPSGGPTNKLPSPFRGLPERIRPLAERIADVQLECRDAVDVLAWTAPKWDVMIYVDPPYPTARHDYYESQVDQGALNEALLAQEGNVAVSGYPGERPALLKAGWREVRFSTRAQGGNQNLNPRSECLWLNYEVPDVAA